MPSTPISNVHVHVLTGAIRVEFCAEPGVRTVRRNAFVASVADGLSLLGTACDLRVVNHNASADQLHALLEFVLPV